MKKLLLVACLATALSACGGDDDKPNKPIAEEPTPPVVEDPVTPEEPGDTEETREEMIERVLSLPPKPDEELNNSTVEGVDSNGNGVRDDIEREIAFKFHPDQFKMNIANESARLNREIIINFNNPSEVLKLQELLMNVNFCKNEELNRYEKLFIEQLTNENTDLRKNFKRELMQFDYENTQNRRTVIDLNNEPDWCAPFK